MMRAGSVLVSLVLVSCSPNKAVDTDATVGTEAGTSADTGAPTGTSTSTSTSAGTGTSTGAGAGTSTGAGTDTGTGTDIDTEPTTAADTGETGETGAVRCDGPSAYEITVLASGVVQPGTLALDPTHVWWVGAPGYMMNCAKDGCANAPTTVLTEQPNPIDIIVDGGKVYWSLAAKTGLCGSDGFVMQCDADDCEATATSIVLSVCSAGLAVDAKNVYIAEYSGGAGTVERCARTGCGGNSDEVAAVSGGPTSVAVSGSTLVWTAGPAMPGDDGAVFTCNAMNCVPQVLATGPKILPASIATDVQRAYWPNGDGSIMACALTGCDNKPQVLATGQDFAATIATDGVDVVWGTTPMGPGGVYKIAVDGSEPEPTTVATGAMVFSPGSVAMDADSIYWTDFNTDLIVRARKCP